MQQEINATLAQVEIGLDAEQFLNSKLGKYLIGVAQQESDEAMRELKFVDPTNSGKIMQLQIKAQVAEAAIKWIGEAVLIGRQSEHSLMQIEGEIDND